ncbi:MAG TPA: LysR family transcriptional regulator [Spongiibacteraceae bacterium]|nr:LysR family transcriptional regulator [Spongiibacteraceae bacterium]
MHYTLRQLEVFLAVARTQNISRAAEALAMSQSAVSGSLSDLEGHFDVKLFDRIGKRIQLNEFGKALRPKAQALIEQANDLEQALRRHSDIGRLQLGATLTIGNYLAVELMAKFMREQPGAQVTLEVANTADIINKVANFELDVALIEGEISHPDLEISVWHQDELSIFCAPSHPYASKQQLSDTDLLDATWIVRETGSGTRQTFDRAMHGLLPNLKIMLELQHTEAIKRAVEAGLGIGCISRVALNDAFRRGGLVALNAPDRDFRRNFYFVVHRQKYRSEGIQRWLTLCREHVSN